MYSGNRIVKIIVGMSLLLAIGLLLACGGKSMEKTSPADVLADRIGCMLVMPDHLHA